MLIRRRLVKRKVWLTIKNRAPSKTALRLTSRSIGKEMQKLSASVNSSLIKPLHCLAIVPICTVESRLISKNLTSRPGSEAMKLGVLILNTHCPSALNIWNLGWQNATLRTMQPSRSPLASRTIIFSLIRQQFGILHLKREKSIDSSSSEIDRFGFKWQMKTLNDLGSQPV